MHFRLYLKALGVCAVLLILANLALVWLKQDPRFFEFFAHTIPSPQVLADVLQAQAKSPKPKILVMGDSVVYGSGLHAHGVKAWRQHSLPAYLQAKLPAYEIIDISLDGALPMDYLALYQMTKNLKKEWIIFDLNYRMFSDQYQQGRQAISRIWLITALPQNNFGLSYTFTTADQVLMQLRNFFLLFRYSEAMRSRIFFPSREERFNQWLQYILPAKSWKEPEDKEWLLKLKLKPYYYTSLLTEKAAAVQALQMLFLQMQKQQQKYVVYFAPQNQEFIADIYNVETYTQNLRYLHTWMKKFTHADTQIYYDWSKQFPSPAFFDHCHLLPEYNEKLAQALAESLQPKEQRVDGKNKME